MSVIALGVQSLRRIPELDYVIEGEAELAFASLLEALEKKRGASQIPRLCYRLHREVRRNPPGPLLNLSDLPPMWTTLQDSIRLDRYAETTPRQSARRLVYIEAGRGCPFACTFCATSPFWQRKYRVKPIRRILDEIRFLHQEFGYDSFILVHDLLTVDQQFISEFCDAMLDARLPVDLATRLKLWGVETVQFHRLRLWPPEP